MKTYKVIIRCSNCEQKRSVKIPTGTIIEAYVKDMRCKKCGCTLR